MGTIIVGGIVLCLTAAAIGSMIHDKKNGKSIQCGGDCKHCGGHCGQ
ncbi:attachment p12 family protein [Kineothrix alysoides]|uniref:Attachment p12 family protein n=1 Tax=Kineothrix alysoides TaxID=1469948 RepID=A0A4R1QZT1_9FIRM|nr:FeoB-associated Cys-rich membrane protein [Kineothrix alysoides]TCL58499.1 attachment p12 family protein [Kineothrix alysoides]